MAGSRAHCGFTLVELLVTVVIVAILASAVFPMAKLNAQRAKEQELRKSLREIREAIDAYKQAGDEGRILRKANESGYPPSLDILVKGVTDARSPKEAKLYFLRRLPRDPLNEDDSLPPEKAWGVRSYESSPDDPREGKDVFDIYSLAPGTGLNGVAYRKW